MHACSKMASTSTREQHNISETAPHFFKSLHDASIQQATLKIPEAFVSKHGKDISDPVLLKDPSGTEWQVKLTKCCSTGDWSLDGLREFMEYYSLQSGHFLFLRYEGRSSFCVTICDKSASEIEYPVGDRNALVQEGESNGKEPSKVSEAGRTRFNIACSENHKRKPCSYSGFEDVVSREFMASGTQKTMVASKKSRALQMATSFKSKNPFFPVVMQPSYVCNRFRMNVPLRFAAKYFLKDHGSIDLWVSNGGPWRVKYSRYSSRAYSFSRVEFNLGWKAFSQDNKLVVGDVCVFELISGMDSSLEVSIYRSCEDSSSHAVPRVKFPKIEESCDELHPQKTSTICLGAGSNVVKLEKPNRKSGFSSHQELEAEWRKMIKAEESASVYGSSNNSSQVKCSESAAEHRSDYPFFRVTIHGSFLNSSLNVPKGFVRKHIRERSCSVKLQVADKSWNVESRVYKDGSCKFCQFPSFARANSLREGDVCTFELIESDEMLFKVSIVRRIEKTGLHSQTHWLGQYILSKS